MGQYYYPTILTVKGKRHYSQQFYSHDYDHNGLKLTEHSYVGNCFVETVLAQLYNKPGFLAWMGDYHEPGDIKDATMDKLFRRHYKKFYYRHNSDGTIQTNYTKVKMVNERKGRFILNHTKHQFINMVDYEALAPKDEWGCQLHPIPLLTAVGNGRGGGDYYGIYMDDIGSWAGDLIEVQDFKPNGYLDITDSVMFKEGR